MQEDLTPTAPFGIGRSCAAALLACIYLTACGGGDSRSLDPKDEAPRAPVRDGRPKRVRWQFALSGELAPWQTWMPNAANRGVSIRLPGTIDQNHLDGIGPIYLIAHLPMALTGWEASYFDLRGAMLTIRARTDRLELHGGRIVWWIVSEVPSERLDPGFPWQQANWALTATPVDLPADSRGESVEVRTSLTADERLWTYPGTSIMDPCAGRYVRQSLHDTLSKVDATLHLVILGCDRASSPSGTITLEEIKVELATGSYVPSETEIESAVSSGDMEAAGPLLELGARHGSDAASFHLGCALKYGLGADVDHRRALGLLRIAARSQPEAVTELADSLIKGLGVAADPRVALELLSDPDVAQLPRALYLRGILTLNGRGTEVDPAQGRRLLEQAASLGCKQSILPAAFAAFDAGDYERAYYWLCVARAQGEQAGAVGQLIDRRLSTCRQLVAPSKLQSIDAMLSEWLRKGLGNGSATK